MCTADEGRRVVAVDAVTQVRWGPIVVQEVRRHRGQVVAVVQLDLTVDGLEHRDEPGVLERTALRVAERDLLHRFGWATAVDRRGERVAMRVGLVASRRLVDDLEHLLGVLAVHQLEVLFRVVGENPGRDATQRRDFADPRFGAAADRTLQRFAEVAERQNVGARRAGRSHHERLLGGLGVFHRQGRRSAFGGGYVLGRGSDRLSYLFGHLGRGCLLFAFAALVGGVDLAVGVTDRDGLG